MNTTQTEKNIETRNIILKLEDMYRRELESPWGIHTEAMREYHKVRDEALAGIIKMELDNQ